MDRLHAIVELMREARKEKGTVTGYKRARRALAALELSEEDQKTALAHLDYYNPTTREPYSWLAAKL